MKIVIIIGSFLAILFVMGLMSQFDPEVEPISYHQMINSK